MANNYYRKDTRNGHAPATTSSKYRRAHTSLRDLVRGCTKPGSELRAECMRLAYRARAEGDKRAQKELQMALTNA